MPYNGVGVFQSLGTPIFPAVTGEYILASSFNATMNDIFAGLSTAFTKDGQSALAADLDLAGFKVVNLGQGAANSDAVNFGQVFNSPHFNGTPSGATAAPGTSTEQFATTEFVTLTAFAGVTQNPTPPFVLQSLGVI